MDNHFGLEQSVPHSIPTHAGYIAIVGKPNVGKSTLMNAIVGTKLSIVSNKPQTTRKRVLGIYSTETTQIVFLDTPGIIKPRYELQRTMMTYVEQSISGADAILILLEAQDFGKRQAPDPTKLLTDTRTLVGNPPQPIVVAFNKMDALHDKKQVLPYMDVFLSSGFAKECIALSGLQNKYVDDLLTILSKYMPENPFFYDPENLSELPERFFVSELIREVIFHKFREEIPYSTEVHVIDFKEREQGKWFISAEIIVERDTQKRIVIGEGASQLKIIGQQARTAIEEHLGQPVYLELFVKVREGWRENPTHLRSFGY